MKAAGGPQKLRFTIHSCSGEVRLCKLLWSAACTHNKLCTNFLPLSHHRIQTIPSENSCTIAPKQGDGSLPGESDGGCTSHILQQPERSLTAEIACLCRFCKYPQELVLRLERPCKIQQIQILAHEYKVSSKWAAHERGCVVVLFAAARRVCRIALPANM